MIAAVVDASVWVSATDGREPHHAESAACLLRLNELGWRVVVPSLARLEVSCALARQFQNPKQARRITAGLLKASGAVEVPLDAGALERAQLIGTEQYLRASDAVYAAEAASTGMTLISWDDELIKRAGAVSPTIWLLANA
jgi:predicted nucleic acid-binding protein